MADSVKAPANRAIVYKGPKGETYLPGAGGPEGLRLPRDRAVIVPADRVADLLARKDMREATPAETAAAAKEQV